MRSSGAHSIAMACSARRAGFDAMLLFVGLGNPGAALRRQPAQYRLHGGRGDRQAPWLRAVAAALSGRRAEGSIGARARAAAAAGHLHERIRAARWPRPRISTSSGVDDIVVVPRRGRSAARQGAGQDRRRHRRPQRPALDHRACRQRLQARAHRHRPSGRQGTGARRMCWAISPRDERAWVEALCDIDRRQCRAAGRRRGCELSEQGASRHGGQRLCRRRAGRRAGSAPRQTETTGQ